MLARLEYTIQQVEFINYLREKVIKLFQEYPVTVHGIDHTQRVVGWAMEIAKKEKSKNAFLCEVSAWLHDIGRVAEHYGDNKEKKAHHELSYEMLKEWYKKDKFFNYLLTGEKKEILYCVRFHWNDAANDYSTAWILRDADKLDTLGKIGLDRLLNYFADDDKAINTNLRFLYGIYYWLKTDTAKKIVEEEELLKPINEFYKKYLQGKIEKVEL